MTARWREWVECAAAFGSMAAMILVLLAFLSSPLWAPLVLVYAVMSDRNATVERLHAGAGSGSCANCHTEGTR